MLVCPSFWREMNHMVSRSLQKPSSCLDFFSRLPCPSLTTEDYSVDLGFSCPPQSLFYFFVCIITAKDAFLTTPQCFTHPTLFPASLLFFLFSCDHSSEYTSPELFLSLQSHAALLPCKNRANLPCIVTYDLKFWSVNLQHCSSFRWLSAYLLGKELLVLTRSFRASGWHTAQILLHKGEDRKPSNHTHSNFEGAVYNYGKVLTCSLYIFITQLVFQ